jgi:hypothetical protein
MVQRGGSLGLPLEAAEGLCVVSNGWAGNFQKARSDAPLLFCSAVRELELRSGGDVGHPPENLPSCARLGPFGFAQGRLARAPVPTRAKTKATRAKTKTCSSYCSFAYSALASFRMGRSGSASFHRARKS